jgi:hypothetical protein
MLTAADFLAFIVRVEIIRHQPNKYQRHWTEGTQTTDGYLVYIYRILLLASLQPAPAAGPAVIWHLSSLIAATPGCCLL